MANKVYDNFVLENKLEDLLDTQLNLNQFCTVDNSLAETAGMVKKVHTYTFTGDVEDLAMGAGNTGSIEASFKEVPYTVGTTQGRFAYYDEEAMTDPKVVETGLYGIATSMTNDLTAKIIKEFGKATLKATVADTTKGIQFSDVVDAIAQYPYEAEEGLFLLINPADKAKLRNNLKDDLKYSEGFARTGYIGSVAGVPVYVSKAVPAKTAFLADRKAVTIFVKKGSETEQHRDPNTRQNTVYGRKVMLVALTDNTRAIAITTGANA